METKQNENTVELSKDFSVPVERLFQAWTEPEELKQWWHPMDNTLENVINELHEGGLVEYNFQDKNLKISGNYQEVSPNEKLVYSWNWELTDSKLHNASYTLTITFESAEGGSRLHVKQEGSSEYEATQSLEEGWKNGLDDLDAYLSQSSDSTQSNDSGNSKLEDGNSMYDRSGGYGESPEQAKVGGG